MDDFKNQVYSIEEFLELVKSKQDRKASFDPEFNYAVYSSTDEFKSEMKVFIGDPLDIGGNDNEILPDFVFHNKLHYMCSDENIQDVVDLAITQQADVTSSQLIMALNHYLEKDDFLDFK
ncbi:hypothetical protein J2795_003102 [Chryseobacterium bernardetii]|jgi:hypothetical protein|uniref:DUF7716 domain-containing protein n=2 Tax=Chryseobacterium TaxID=59732 RepID=A0A543EKW2_9FLAO|nr:MULTISPECIES: hypothetical protein [Chryseobacterium]MDR6372239.1 hypothetical protein [Chryseobacterium vietnamense]MDR6442377.1 hypothetical protein [Chryseobacterium bernardetii]TQM22216.1 hypothetical protein FB551_1925 [Chryseobacterium aquifrigidense]